MKKIPTIFERDWDGDRSRVLDKPVSDCEWVFTGEGVATRKYDGTSCLLTAGGRLLKRHEVRPGKEAPEGFVEVERDDETGKTVGWVPVGDGPEDRWHREAFERLEERPGGLYEGTYELLGPKVQGNPEGFPKHTLLLHAQAERYDNCPRTFEGLRDFLASHDIEGIVFHRADGRMAKIKARDFGIKRKALVT